MHEATCRTAANETAILIVDDDRSVCDAYSVLLARLGYVRASSAILPNKKRPIKRSGARMPF
jgi:DNA-binding NtrC family response regulator